MSKRWLIAAGWLALLVLGAWLALARTPVSTDLTLFIPARDARSALLLEQLRSGPATRLILIGLEGGTEQQRATTSQALAERLRTSGRFLQIANGSAVLDAAEQQRLAAYRYLLSPNVTPERFSAAGLRAALEQRLQELASPLSVLTKRLLPTDPSGEFLAMLQTWQTDRQPEKRQGVWFSPDGRRALLLAETRASGFDLEAQDQALAAIQQSFAASRQEPVRMLLSGPGVFGTLSQAVIRAETQWLSTLASTLMIALLWLVYRSPWIVLLSALPLLSAVVMGMATVGLIFGGIYGITLAFGVTLLGVAGDYPIHGFIHWRPPEPLEQSLRRIWPTLRVGVITTAIGYLAMLSTDFVGLAQLGVFAISGLLAAAAVTRWVLPTLVSSAWTPPRTASVTPSAWLLPLLHPPRFLALALGTLGLTVAMMLLSGAPRLWEDDLAALSPIPAELVQLDRELRAELGAPEAGHVIVITAPDAETALQHSEALADWLTARVQQGALSGFTMAAHYLPSQRIQRQRQAALPAPASLTAHLHEALQGLSFKPGLFQPFLDAVEQARTSSLLEPQHLTGTALELRVSSLLFEQAGEWRALIPLSGVQNGDSLAHDLAKQGSEGVHYFDLKAETNRLIAVFRHEALLRTAWGALLLGVVLGVSLRSPRRLLLVLLPVTLALVIDVAVLLALGKRLSLFHLVSLLLVMGLCIDISLFFSLPGQAMEGRVRTLYAVLLCNGSTLAVFGMLSLSTLPVLQAIGQTVAIGVLVSFLMALVMAQQTATSPDPAAERH
jgi:predicted exporter